jgi:hypothetical protein
MTTDQATAEGLVASVPAEGARFDQTSIALHWLRVLLIVAQFASAWLHEVIDHETSLAMVLLTMHRTPGLLTWIVVVARLVWRSYFARLPPFPPSIPKLQLLVAKATSNDQDCLSHKQNESMVLKVALVCMVRHLQRELSRRRLAELNLPLEWNGKADAKFVCCAQHDNALGRVGRLLDDPRRERVRIAQALVPEARLKRSIDQPRQRH